jgi:hypothetical protein
MKGVLLAALVAVLASAMVPSVASAGPEPGAKKKGFRLFARALGAMTVNRIYCGLAAAGQICVDSTNSSTIGGGFWPKGTADQYVFNSGLQIAGVIGANGGPWANDTVGGFFFDPKGTTEHGEQVQPIYNASNPADLAAWPEAACVPFGDASQTLFDDLLVTDPTNSDPTYSYPCRKSASQGDIWFMSWEGNTGLRAGRKHPLGIVAEQRGMGWNFPSGNEDIIYFIYTFYNVSTTDPAKYTQHRASMQPILLQKAQDLHAGAASLGVTLPAAGYTISNMFAAFAADMDVGDAGSNYASVNLPFALGYTYDHAFSQAPGWTFDPSLFSAPFFAGAGFIGVKYLKSPTGAGAIQLFGNTVNGTPFAGAVNDPRDVPQLFRYLSGTLSPATGDQACNTGAPTQTRICFVNNTSPADMRFFQSSTPLTLEPGEAGSIVVAYIFAAPVTTGGCAAGCDVKPGDATRLTDPIRLLNGANTVDSLTGFRGWADGNSDGVVEQSEFTTVKGSLLGKATVAQSVFDNKFLLPFAPSAVDFFLVPGDNQVTVMWKPSASEASGDPFFAIASTATKVSDGTNNPLYDPNYRQFDVEGYRVYRGRVDAPNELQLLAQYDYTGTVISDYTGIVNPTVGCAPEFGINSDCVENFAPNLKDGTTLTTHVDYDLSGDIIQVQAGTGRTELANGEALVLKADTAVVGGGTDNSCGPRATCPALSNTGVPFVFVDRTPRNNFRYFYSVTAFDVNSIESGPTSLESPRNTKSVRPVRGAANYATNGEITSTQIVGRGTVLNPDAPIPTIDPVKGTFSGPFPPSNAWNIGLGAFVAQVLAEPGNLSATLDSVVLGSPYQGTSHLYYITASANGTKVAEFAIPLTLPQEIGVTSGSTAFRAVPIDNDLANQFGGSNDYSLPGEVGIRLPGTDYLGLFGRGCVNGRAGFSGGTGCDYNGSRWFSGANETLANPASCNQHVNTTVPAPAPICFNNAGALDGVNTIAVYNSYFNAPGVGGRELAGVFAGVHRAADYRVYWGTAGKVDSVIDITHNVVVPGPDQGFATHIGSTWGILNPSAVAGNGPDGVAQLTMRDFACVEPLRSMAVGSFTCASAAVTLSSTAIPGPVAFSGGITFPPAANARVTPGTGAGFVMYMPGDLFTFDLTGGVLPAAGTVWTLRSYVGAIRGGTGAGGSFGDYVYSNPDGSSLENGDPNKPPARGWLPFTSVGSEIRANYVASNTLSAPTARGLRNVHTVPDPYYVTNGYEQTTDSKILKFVNLPTQAIIRIYSSSGVLVNVIEHPGTNCQNVNLNGTVQNPTGGECTWNVRNRNNQVVASGVYFYHIESNVGGGTARRVGRMTIVNFAQ